MINHQHQIYLAPLQSYTTMFYRAAHHRTFGSIDKYFTPFFEEGKNGLPEPLLYKDLTPVFNKDIHVIPQVATNNTQFLLDFARQISELGYTELNINMGCPFPMLVKRQKGGGLMAQFQLVDHLLEAIEKAKNSIEVSVKIRAGLDNFTQGLQLIEVLNQHQLSEVIIHPRLVTQKYKGEPHWDAFKAMLNTCKHPVVANGDIFSVNNYQKVAEEFPGLNQLMLGRGILEKPWLSHTIKGLAIDKNESFFELHQHFFEIIRSHFNNWYQGFNHLLNFWYYPLNNFTEGKRRLRQLKKHNTLEKYKEWAKQIKEVIYHYL